MAHGTELARDFCAGIGPLQLGVVLVFVFILLTSSGYMALILAMLGDWCL